jgi:hypothetical protein
MDGFVDVPFIVLTGLRVRRAVRSIKQWNLEITDRNFSRDIEECWLSHEEYYGEKNLIGASSLSV